MSRSEHFCFLACNLNQEEYSTFHKACTLSVIRSSCTIRNFVRSGKWERIDTNMIFYKRNLVFTPLEWQKCLLRECCHSILGLRKQEWDLRRDYSCPSGY